MWPYSNIICFSFSPVIKTGSVCKILAQKLPVQLVEQFKDSLAKKIALGRYQVVNQCFLLHVVYVITSLLRATMEIQLILLVPHA